jgi:putative pyruvate formate lyase activating enzyme
MVSAALHEPVYVALHRQVGVALPRRDGLVRRGLTVRHLVMPGGVSGMRAVIDWIAANLPVDTRLTLMSQYRPTAAP